MPKKPQKKSNLTIVREGLGVSQAEFARRLGVSASMIKKVELGKRPMTQDLSSRIFAESGVMFVAHATYEPIIYTKETHSAWVEEVQFNQKSAAVATRVVLKLVELMLSAASRPGVQKSYQIFNALIQSVEKVKNDFGMEKHIDAELRDRQSTETKRYIVGELRGNALLAKMVDFKDDPELKDDDTLTLTKTTGWLPARELFNAFWQHRELINEILRTQNEDLSDEQTAKLDDAAALIEKAINREVDRFGPAGGAT